MKTKSARVLSKFQSLCTISGFSYGQQFFESGVHGTSGGAGGHVPLPGKGGVSFTFDPLQDGLTLSSLLKEKPMKTLT